MSHIAGYIKRTADGGRLKALRNTTFDFNLVSEKSIEALYRCKQTPYARTMQPKTCTQYGQVDNRNNSI
ncbi:hypothetical protein AFLA_003823 [Aspergillus flavus NRRL3357]|nr:hypothetical protein AFLA_003823 [Aspergillus flavus NRRL3357]